MRTSLSTDRLRRRLALLLAFLAALAVVTLPSPPTASAATAGPVVGQGSGRCLDVRGNTQASGTGVIIWDCSGRLNQEWTFTAAGELRVFNGTRCLDVAGQDTTAPARVQIYTCNGGDNQKWRLTGGAIVGVQSGLCLDVSSNKTANSSTVGMWTCNGQSNQRWAVRSADSEPPTVPANARVSGLTCDSVTFAWNAATDNVGVAFYDIYHDGQLMKSVSGTALSTSLTVVPGATWGLYVNARDAAGYVSQASATVTITPPQCQVDTTHPTAPTALTGSAAGTTVTLAWTAATDNTGVRAYEIYRAGAKVGTISGTAQVPPTTRFVDSGLTARTAYAYYVIAKDGQANSSPASNTVTVTTGAACGNAVCSVTQIGTDTDIPWGLVTLPDGTILYGRRDAQTIVRLNPTTGTKTTVGTVPNVRSTDGEGGLLGLEIASTFATDRWVYIMHTSPTDNRVVRIKLETDNTLNTGTEQVLLKGVLHNKYHNGGRLRFGPDGKLYVATGDALNGNYSQDKARLNGKILRLNPDGTVPSDNPFGTAIWSYGHRNPQGLAFDSQGRLWEQEFGNSVMDETNLITKGGNYGWPACEGTRGSCGTAGFIAPKRTYPTSEGSCSGIAIVRDVLYVACQRGARMYREQISGSSLTNVTQLFLGTYGRLRTVEPTRDGGLWMSTSNSGDKDSIPNNSNEKIFKVTLGG